MNLVIWRIIRPSRFSERSSRPTSAARTDGQRVGSVSTSLYVFASIFIIFDVEAVFLLPWAWCSSKLGQEQGLLPYVEGLVFIAILVVALAYVWRKGDLEWVRAEDRTRKCRDHRPRTEQVQRLRTSSHRRSNNVINWARNVEACGDDVRPGCCADRDDVTGA